MDLRSTRLRGDADIAITSFVAARHPTESCGTNGLPLTPNSVAILGQSQRLRLLAHKNLCTHLDCVRGKHERIVTVSDCYAVSLADDDAGVDDGDRLLKIMRQTLAGLAYLHRHGIVHATLEPSRVMLDSEGDVRLYNYGMGHLTNYGEYVAFPIFNPRFAAPEVVAAGPPVSELERAAAAKGDKQEEGGGESEDEMESLNMIPPEPQPRYDPRCDTWSLGMVAACAALDLPRGPWPSLKVPQIARKLLSLGEYQGNVLDRIARESDRADQVGNVPAAVRELIDACLQPDLEKRPSASELLEEKFPEDDTDVDDGNMFTFPTLRLRCNDLDAMCSGVEDGDDEEQPLDVLTIQETYYLWKLAGGDVLGELTRHGLMVTRPPLLSLPKLVLVEGHAEGQRKERSSLYDPVVIRLSLEQLRSCLAEITTEDCYPLLLENGFAEDRADSDTTSTGAMEADETAALPLVIKEGDVKYQFKRIVLYRRLLQCYPFQRPRLWTEARVDSLPQYRAFIWAALLGVEHDTAAAYGAVDKETWTPTDRQIEVDIPRCHQYNNLLASPEGHRKFKRVLKAWVAANPEYVYWQGLDSLCAPFLYLNFNDEALAFACLSAFIPKYLHGMFQKDNAAVIQEYLAKFRHIQAFHDPELFNHLDDIGFIPDLYAIPWILTMFAHVFPLQSIFHLWDKLLLGNSAFPLCIGLAVLYQLRERLLSAEFNDCILLFSDLPAVDIERCVKDSVHIFCTTPKSLTWRKFGSAPGKKERSRRSNGIRMTREDEIIDDPVMSDLRLDSVTLTQQKSEKVPRMSGEELLALLGIDSEIRRRKNRMMPHRQNGADDGDEFIGRDSGKSRVLVLDVRPAEEFRLGALPDSVNVPGGGQEGLARIGPDLSTMKKGKVLCVVGSREDTGLGFSELLLESGHSRVCFLHGGVDVFRSLEGVLRVPDT